MPRPARGDYLSHPANAGVKWPPYKWLTKAIKDNLKANQGVGEQRIRLLGPFHVAHDDEGLDSGIALADLEEGVWLLDVCVVPTEQGNGVGVDFQIGLAGPDVADPYPGWISADDLTVNTPQGGSFTKGLAVEPTFTFSPVGLTAPGCLYVLAAWDEPVATGEWDIYALIAEPVAE